MQHILCPQCGAEVRFQSAAAVMAVCGACGSTLLKDGETARSIGMVGQVIEDCSPVQIGTRGQSAGQQFTVVGRLQLRYDAGYWNEWYLLFDDGSNGWLSDASGQYAITRPLQDAAPPPLRFEALEPGAVVSLQGQAFVVSDIRDCACTGGQGELPMVVGQGWRARVADLRAGDGFATLDYSDGEQPLLYLGTRFGGAPAQGAFDNDTLRDDAQILRSAGRYRGQVQALACPQCGGTVTVVAALATQVACPACGSALDFSEGQGQVIAAERRMQAFRPRLPAGATGRLGGVDYTIIGIIQCDVPDDSSEPAWFEYLLFAPGNPFLWLIQTSEGWQRATVCERWPVVAGKACRLDGTTWTMRHRYRSRVRQAVGAFNWRVRHGDTTAIVEFVQGQQVLNRETSDAEVTWSLATPLPLAELAAAFKRPDLAAFAPSSRQYTGQLDTEDDQAWLTKGLRGIALLASIAVFVLVDGPAAIMLGLLLLWVPAILLDAAGWGQSQ